VRAGAWWSIGVVLAIGAVGVALFGGTEGGAPEPAPKVRARELVAPEDLARLPINRERRIDRTGFRRLGGEAPLTVEAIDEALSSGREGIEACVQASRIHRELPDPLPVTLSLVPRADAPRSLGVDAVSTEVPDPALGPCIAEALRTVELRGDEPIEIRAVWPPP